MCYYTMHCDVRLINCVGGNNNNAWNFDYYFFVMSIMQNFSFIMQIDCGCRFLCNNAAYCEEQCSY